MMPLVAIAALLLVLAYYGGSLDPVVSAVATLAFCAILLALALLFRREQARR